MRDESFDIWLHLAAVGEVSGGRGIRTHENVAVLIVFKSIGDSLPGSVATWAFSGRARRGTQDHPVYIPRAVRWRVCCMAAEHLFRRSVPARAVASTP
jgi:hypothetical protein